LIGIGLFILQILPGYGRFMVYVNVPGGPFLESFHEYQGGKIIDYQFYAEQSLMIASVLLYAYCIIVIVYEVLFLLILRSRAGENIHKRSQKEFKIVIPRKWLKNFVFPESGSFKHLHATAMAQSN
jgi:hypothetical protein